MTRPTNGGASESWRQVSRTCFPSALEGLTYHLFSGIYVHIYPRAGRILFCDLIHSLSLVNPRYVQKNASNIHPQLRYARLQRGRHDQDQV